MFRIETAIKENRNESRAISATPYKTDKHAVEIIDNWKNAVESLRLAVSRYAVAAHEDRDHTADEVFDRYKAILAFFTNKSTGFKLHAEKNDLESLLTFCGSYRKASRDADKKEFLPYAATTFRNSFEKFVADRLDKVTHKTAEEIEAEKAARREERRVKRAADKVREKAKAKAREMIAENGGAAVATASFKAVLDDLMAQEKAGTISKEELFRALEYAENKDIAEGGIGGYGVTEKKKAAAPKKSEKAKSAKKSA